MKVGSDLNAARDALVAGDIVAYPTEGVFGLGCDPGNLTAIENLLNLKKRNVGQGFILIAAEFDQLQPFIGTLTADIKKKLDESWPGPVTWILPANDSAPALITGGKPTIATRVTDHPIACALCRQCNSAIISTSANISGQAACLTADAVAELFADQPGYILDHEIGNLQGPTPIYDGLTGQQLR